MGGIRRSRGDRDRILPGVRGREGFRQRIHSGCGVPAPVACCRCRRDCPFRGVSDMIGRRPGGAPGSGSPHTRSDASSKGRRPGWMGSHGTTPGRRSRVLSTTMIGQAASRTRLPGPGSPCPGPGRDESPPPADMGPDRRADDPATMSDAVADCRRLAFRIGQLAPGVVERLRGKAGIEPGPHIAKPDIRHDRAVFRAIRPSYRERCRASGRRSSRARVRQTSSPWCARRVWPASPNRGPRWQPPHDGTPGARASAPAGRRTQAGARGCGLVVVAHFDGLRHRFLRRPHRFQEFRECSPPFILDVGIILTLHTDRTSRSVSSWARQRDCPTRSPPWAARRGTRHVPPFW